MAALAGGAGVLSDRASRRTAESSLMAMGIFAGAARESDSVAERD
jgi:hypothetical protein